jgi:glycosyltransferase involved in cell wall biosynthesis
MDGKLSVCLLNDSFPPVFDGVSNTVLNYAMLIHKNHGRAVVATPSYPDAQDDFPFPVVRYPSFDMTKSLGYRAGWPLSPPTIRELAAYRPDIIHTHCPMVSTLLARSLRANVKAPVVLTYHTKFDVDIAQVIDSELLQTAAIRVMLGNINACDEVWTVSRGSGENLRKIGYRGDYVVMTNGVDFPRGKAPKEAVDALRNRLGLKESDRVFLFVGRMRWYKGIRIILDGLSIAARDGYDFKMVFVGDGADFEEIKAYAASLPIAGRCIFTGAERDRETLRAYYSLAEMFLLPSTFDNRPIVVLEATACGLPSILVRGSSSAEGMTDGQNALLIDESAESLARAVTAALKDPALAPRLGQNAMREVYVSWEDAVAAAVRRYEIVIENYRKKREELRLHRRSFRVRMHR